MFGGSTLWTWNEGKAFSKTLLLLGGGAGGDFVNLQPHILKIGKHQALKACHWLWDEENTGRPRTSLFLIKTQAERCYSDRNMWRGNKSHQDNSISGSKSVVQPLQSFRFLSLCVEFRELNEFQFNVSVDDYAALLCDGCDCSIQAPLKLSRHTNT